MVDAPSNSVGPRGQFLRCGGRRCPSRGGQSPHGRRSVPAATAPRVRAPPPRAHAACGGLVDPEQGLRPGAAPAHRGRGRPGGGAGELPARELGPGDRHQPAARAVRPDLRDLGRRVGLRVPAQARLAQSRAGPGARAPHGRVRPRAGHGPGLLRGSLDGRPHGGPQRRRQPAGALPRHRGQRAPAGEHHRPHDRGRLLLDRAGGRLDEHAADAADPLGLDRVPEAPRTPLPRGARAGRAPQRRPRREPRGHRHDQELHGRGPRGRAHRRALRGLPHGERARDPPELRVLTAHPHGHPVRLHGDPRLRRLPRGQRPDGSGVLLGDGLPHPAAPLAADAARRDLRPVPARHGLDHAHPGPAGHHARDRVGDWRGGRACADGGPALRGSRLLLRLRGARARGAGPRLPGRSNHGPRRLDGLRQDDRGQAAPALLRPDRGARHPRGRRPP